MNKSTSGVTLKPHMTSESLSQSSRLSTTRVSTQRFDGNTRSNGSSQLEIMKGSGNGNTGPAAKSNESDSLSTKLANLEQQAAQISAQNVAYEQENRALYLRLTNLTDATADADKHIYHVAARINAVRTEISHLNLLSKRTSELNDWLSDPNFKLSDFDLLENAWLNSTQYKNEVLRPNENPTTRNLMSVNGSNTACINSNRLSFMSNNLEHESLLSRSILSEPDFIESDEGDDEDGSETCNDGHTDSKCNPCKCGLNEPPECPPLPNRSITPPTLTNEPLNERVSRDNYSSPPGQITQNEPSQDGDNSKLFELIEELKNRLVESQREIDLLRNQARPLSTSSVTSPSLVSSLSDQRSRHTLSPASIKTEGNEGINFGNQSLNDLDYSGNCGVQSSNIPFTLESIPEGYQMEQAPPVKDAGSSSSASTPHISVFDSQVKSRDIKRQGKENVDLSIMKNESSDLHFNDSNARPNDNTPLSVEGCSSELVKDGQSTSLNASLRTSNWAKNLSSSPNRGIDDRTSNSASDFDISVGQNSPINLRYSIASLKSILGAGSSTDQSPVSHGGDTDYSDRKASSTISDLFDSPQMTDLSPCDLPRGVSSYTNNGNHGNKKDSTSPTTKGLDEKHNISRHQVDWSLQNHNDNNSRARLRQSSGSSVSSSSTSQAPGGTLKEYDVPNPPSTATSRRKCPRHSLQGIPSTLSHGFSCPHVSQDNSMGNVSTTCTGIRATSCPLVAVQQRRVPPVPPRTSSGSNSIPKSNVADACTPHSSCLSRSCTCKDMLIEGASKDGNSSTSTTPNQCRNHYPHKPSISESVRSRNSVSSGVRSHEKFDESSFERKTSTCSIPISPLTFSDASFQTQAKLATSKFSFGSGYPRSMESGRYVSSSAPVLIYSMEREMKVKSTPASSRKASIISPNTSGLNRRSGPIISSPEVLSMSASQMKQPRKDSANITTEESAPLIKVSDKQKSNNFRSLKKIRGNRINNFVGKTVDAWSVLKYQRAGKCPLDYTSATPYLMKSVNTMNITFRHSNSSNLSNNLAIMDSSSSSHMLSSQPMPPDSTLSSSFEISHD